MEFPIIISLAYEGKFLKFPVNPENIKLDRPSNSNTVQIEGLGEVSVPVKPSLSTININSFFWQATNLVPNPLYVAWLRKWQDSKKPALLIITKLNYSMYVTCEHFSYEVKAGEEKDIYFELTLQEYRHYGALRVGIQTPLNLIKKLIDLDLTVPILIDIPIPIRIQNKPSVPDTYSTLAYDTVNTITKKFTGSTEKWKDLYDNNKEIIAKDINLKIGTVLIIPDKWK